MAAWRMVKVAHDGLPTLAFWGQSASPPKEGETESLFSSHVMPAQLPRGRRAKEGHVSSGGKHSDSLGVGG